MVSDVTLVWNIIKVIHAGSVWRTLFISTLECFAINQDLCYCDVTATVSNYDSQLLGGVLAVALVRRMSIETVRDRERRMSNDEDLLILPDVPEPRAGRFIGRIYVGIKDHKSYHIMIHDCKCLMRNLVIFEFWRYHVHWFVKLSSSKLHNIEYN
jgi:hypothetical protein